MQTLDAFTRAFFETALWSSDPYLNGDNDDRSFQDLGYGVDDIDPVCVAKLAAECASFQDEFGAAIDAAPIGPYNHGKRGGEYGTDREIAGHDLWLTRCGHGCGFSDGHWPEPLAAILHDAAKRLGNVDLYLGDDGVIYASGYGSCAEDAA